MMDESGWLRELVRGLAIDDPYYEVRFDGQYCIWCEAPFDEHASDCPWVQARAWLGLEATGGVNPRLP